MFFIKILFHHWPALQVLIPIFSGLVVCLSSNRNFASIFSIFAGFINLIISFYGLIIILSSPTAYIAYNFGGWKMPIGIEYKLDLLNQSLNLYLNFVLLFFLIFAGKLIKERIVNFSLSKDWGHLFYSVLLFAQSGYLGMTSTNDLFNLYVFIEIAALSSYILVAQGSKNSGEMAFTALNYLILGTIGASFILLALAFLLITCGSLNIDDINSLAPGCAEPKILLLACIFFIIGSMIKSALFPLHSWLMKIYSSASSIILVYLAGVSSAVAAYIWFKFLHFVIEQISLYEIVKEALLFFIAAAILWGSFAAYKTRNLRKQMAYSSVSQIGYSFLLWIVGAQIEQILLWIIIDGFNKIGLFFVIANYENQENDKLQYKYTTLLYFFICLLLICSSGIPPSPIFFFKIQIINNLIDNHSYLLLAVTLISSAFSFIYHYKIGELLLLSSNGVERKKDNFLNISAISLIIFIQFFVYYFLNSHSWLK